MITSRERLSSGDDFSQLLSNNGLSGTVHLDLELLDEGTSVVGGGLHGSHTRSELGCLSLLAGTEYLRVKEKRHDGIDQLRWLLLEKHVRRDFFRLVLDGVNLDIQLAILGSHAEHFVVLRL